MSAGLCISILGVGVEAFMDIIKELTETDLKNPNPNPFLQNGQGAAPAAEQGGALRRRDGLEPRRGGHVRFRARVLNRGIGREGQNKKRWNWKLSWLIIYLNVSSEIWY